MDMKQKQDAILYPALTFLLTWSCWGILIVINQPATSTWYSTTLYMLGGISTAIVALLLPLIRDKDTRREYYKRFFHFKIPIMQYVIPILSALAFSAASYLLVLLFDHDTATGLKIQPVYMILPMFFSMVIGGGVEELGWRGVMVYNMKKQNPLWTALVVGFVWGLWHLPLFFIQGVSQYQANYPAFLIGAVGYSFVLTMIYLKSESVIPCIIFHALVNALGGMGFFYANDQNLAVWIDSLSKLIIGIASYLILAPSSGKSSHIITGLGRKA